MKYVFLSAFRNESLTLDHFLREFAEMIRRAGIGDQAVLNLVDDLSTDDSRATIERVCANGVGCAVNVLSAPTNLGNQGAMAYGLARIDVAADDVLITLDCDGEDDVGQTPSIIELGQRNPGKLVLIERGQRADSSVFKLSFFLYKLLFRLLTHQQVVPNNFMLIPGRYVPAIRRAPLVAVHLAYAVLKLNLPSVVVARDRRPRYGGQTTQNLSMLGSHGLVGLMVFYEVVVPKVCLFVCVLAALQVAIALFAPGRGQTMLWAVAGSSLAALALLLGGAVALLCKLIVFNLAVNPRQASAE